MDPNDYIRLSITPPPRNQCLSSTTFTLPPLDGSLTVQQMYDWHYDHSPEHPVFEYAEDDGSITTIRMKEVVPAIHRAGRLVISHFTAHTPTPTKKPVIAMLAASGTRIRMIPRSSLRPRTRR